MPVGWGCIIHRLQRRKGVRPPQWVSWLWHKTIWCWGSCNASLPSLPGLLWPGVVAPDTVLSMGQIELNCVLMPNWIVWNRGVFDIETVLTLKRIAVLHLFWHVNYVHVNCLKWACFSMLNWVVWNGTVFDIETVLNLNWIV